MSESQIEDEQIHYFSLHGFVYTNDEIKVHYVHDVNTVTLILTLHERKYKWRCRLLDIDTPETKKNIYESRDIMIELLDESKLLDITIYCYEFDKYGRVFIRLSINHIEYGLIKDVSTWIIENGYCKPYIV